jgi:hypothetical protein
MTDNQTPHRRTELPYDVPSPAHQPDDVRARHAANRSGWNEGAAHYTASLEETRYLLNNSG